MINWFNHMYPYGNLHELNLDWVIATVKRGEKDIADFIGINTIKYADPILWNIESQYEANTVVVDGQTGNAYISVKAVPSGVHLNRTEYWTQIYNYSNVIDTLREQISFNEGDTTTATRPYIIGELVFVNGLLYRVIAPMIAGDSFVVDSNVKKTTIENELDRIKSDIDDEANARTQADTALGQRIDDEANARTQTGDTLNLRIDNEVLARQQADTALGQRIDNEANARTQTGDALNLRIDNEVLARQQADAQLLDKIPLNRFNNKKILIIGDSNSNEVEGVTNWVKVLRTTLPNTVIDNVSYNGALFMGAGGQAKNYFDNISAHYDYIIVACGTNDCYHQSDIGRISLATTNSWDAFGDALSSFYNAVNNKDVTAQVIFVTPIKNVGMSLDGVGRTTPLDVYRAVIIRACSLFGWTLVDAGHCAPMLQPYNTINRNKWLPDGTHMSEDYAPIFCKYVLDTIMSGGDSLSGKGIQSIIPLNHLLASGHSGTCVAYYNSDGSCDIHISLDVHSYGSGIADVPITNLPSYLRPNVATQVCMMGTIGNCVARIMPNGQIQLFPLTTGDYAIDITFNIITSFFEESYQTII